MPTQTNDSRDAAEGEARSSLPAGTLPRRTPGASSVPAPTRTFASSPGPELLRAVLYGLSNLPDAAPTRSAR